VDIRKLPLHERKLLAQGPQVSIHEVGVFLLKVPLNLLLATSHKMQTHITTCPGLDSINILSSKTHGPLFLVLKWLLRNTSSETFIPLPILEETEANLRTYHAARQLGLEDIYTEHIVDRYTKYAKREMPRFLVLSLFESHALDKDDPFLKAAARHLCRLRYRDWIPDQTTFEVYLREHPRLREVMAQIDEEHVKNRQMRAEVKAARGRVNSNADEPAQMQGSKDDHDRRTKKVQEKAHGAGVLNENEVAHIMGRARNVA
jgi:hypothetical protein